MITTHEHETVRTTKDCVFERIEHECITPTRREYFIVRNTLFWVLALLMVTVGAFAVGLTIYAELNAGWEFYAMTHDNGLTFFVSSLPFVWLALLVLMVLLGIYNLRHTDRGYRYPLYGTVLFALAGSLIGGCALHAVGAGSYLERVAVRFMPLHEPSLTRRERMWHQPMRGLYSGVISSIDMESGRVTIRTVKEKEETFVFQSLPPVQLSNLSLGAHIRIMATSGPSGQLVACHFMPIDLEAHSLTDLGARRARFWETIASNTLPEPKAPQVPEELCTKFLYERAGVLNRTRPVPIGISN